MRWHGVIPAVLTLSALLALPAAGSLADGLDPPRLTEVSGQSPFAPGCGLRAPPPFRDSELRPKDTATEPHLAVNPRDPRNIVVAWIQDFGVTHTVAATLDGGRTWRRTDPPGVGECTGGRYEAPFDPWLAFGPDGTAYLVSMSGDVPPGQTAPINALLVNRSTDGGVTWSEPTEAAPRDGYNDHPSIAVDPSDPKRVYVVWASRDGPFGANLLSLELAVSQDGGSTWEPPRVIHTPARPYLVTSGSALTVMGDGTLLYSFAQFDGESDLPGAPRTPRRMYAMRSTDRGETWSEPLQIGTTPRVGAAHPDDGEPVVGENSPSVAAGGAGPAYAVWANRTEEGPSEVVVASSADGATWTAPRALASPPAASILPTVAVAGDGAVGVHWYDFRNDVPGDGRLTTDVWLAHSHDQGGTWVESHLAGPFDMRTAWLDPRSDPGARFVGDYMGAGGLPEGFAAAIVLAHPQASTGKSQVFAGRVRLARRLRVSARPRRLRVGRRRTVTVTVSVGPAARRLHLERALVKIGRRSARTDPRGRARLRIRPRRAGRLHVRARSWEGGRGRATLRVRARRGQTP